MTPWVAARSAAAVAPPAFFQARNDFIITARRPRLPHPFGKAGPGHPAQESIMAITPRSTNVRSRLRLPTPAGNGLRQTAVRGHRLRPVPDSARRRVNAVTVGFWLGGFFLGTAGCILGACTPYRHPVAIGLSVLWWGIYCGGFGASIGALFGLWKNRTDLRRGPTTFRSPADLVPSQAPRPQLNRGA
jgi:hypothetical protein